MWRMRMVEPRITGLYPLFIPRSWRLCPAVPRVEAPRPDRRRALELLASCPNGGTEAFMLAHGSGSTWCPRAPQWGDFV